jgi:enoyl-CoA hydratase / 3-hydroxyacyl-CoA dehydrogenase
MSPVDRPEETLHPQPAVLENPLLSTPARGLPKKVSIIGAGTIGPDIGYYVKSAMPGVELVMVDVAQSSLDSAKARLEGYVLKGLKKRKLTEAQAQAVREGIQWTLDYGDIAGSDWVLEAATENLPLKRRIFAQIEAVVSPTAVITSNTSSLPAERMFSELAHPERATVTHFFAPAFRNPAVEVIRWDRCAPDVVAWLRWLFASTGKVPLVTEDVLCFMLDRVFDNWCNDAALLLPQATASQIDAVAEEFVHAGPFFVLNMARGNPIIVEANILQMEEGDAYLPADIFKSVDTWVTKKPGRPLDVADALRASLRDRLLGVLLSQSFDIVDRDIGSSSDLALGCKLALGFKKDPFEIMAGEGVDGTTRIMERYAVERAGMPGPTAPIAEYQDFRRHVLVDDLDGVKVLTMRRPQAMNALDDEVTDELLATIRAFEDDDATVGFVITGYGNKAFSAGADIGRFPEVLGDAAGAVDFARATSRLLVHLDGMEKPVVAALNGFALGGGLELALRCHSLVGMKNAWLQFPEVTLGIAPGIGGMVVPYRRWPQAASVFHDMLRVAKKLDAATAAELGILDGLADDIASLVALAADRVRALSGTPRPSLDGAVEIPPMPAPSSAGEPPKAGRLVLSRQVVGMIGQAIQDGAAAATFGEALELGYQSFGATACTAAAREGVTAFGQRRPADFETTG